MCALQLIELARNLFDAASLPLFLRSYRIVSTDASTGVIEVLTDAISIDALKKRQLQSLNDATRALASAAAGGGGGAGGSSSAGNSSVGLVAHFESTYGPSTTARGRDARWRFASSLAAYSAVCYAFAIKDRHNGNVLLDTEGHLVHIDFGFLLGIAPGGAFSIETAPFKLTDEMVQVGTSFSCISFVFKRWSLLCLFWLDRPSLPLVPSFSRCLAMSRESFLPSSFSCSPVPFSPSSKVATRSAAWWKSCATSHLFLVSRTQLRPKSSPGSERDCGRCALPTSTLSRLNSTSSVRCKVLQHLIVLEYCAHRSVFAFVKFSLYRQFFLLLSGLGQGCLSWPGS